LECKRILLATGVPENLDDKSLIRMFTDSPC